MQVSPCHIFLQHHFHQLFKMTLILLHYLYSIIVRICRPSDRTVGRPPAPGRDSNPGRRGLNFLVYYAALKALGMKSDYQLPNRLVWRPQARYQYLKRYLL